MSATLDLNRRAALKSVFASLSAAAVITPDMALAGAAPADWTLGVADVERDVAPHALELIEGRAPKGLTGTLYRNGPAKFRRGGKSASHWFDGDGLIRRFHIGEGGAQLSARFADTPKRRQETTAGRMMVPGFGTATGEGAIIENPDDANAANTSVMMLGQKDGARELLALWEGGSATRMTPDTLATLGFKDWREDLKHLPFSAHPRHEADGSVWNIGWAGRTMVIWHIGADGTLLNASPMQLPRASYTHDFTMTKRHLVLVLQPWNQRGFTMPIVDSLQWEPDQGTIVLVVDKDDLTNVRRYELAAFSAFHYGDAWEEPDGTIRFDGCVSDDPSFGQTAAKALLKGEHRAYPQPELAQIVLHADGRGSVVRTGIEAEFPTSDPRLVTAKRRFSAHVTGYGKTPFPHGLGVFDWERGQSAAHEFGEHQLVEEFRYVPSGSGDEGDGWLVGTTLNLKARATELHVLKAGAVEAGPVASWRSRVALPLGFHGVFV